MKKIPNNMYLENPAIIIVEKLSAVLNHKIQENISILLSNGLMPDVYYMLNDIDVSEKKIKDISLNKISDSISILINKIIYNKIQTIIVYEPEENIDYLIKITNLALKFESSEMHKIYSNKNHNLSKKALANYKKNKNIKDLLLAEQIINIENIFNKISKDNIKEIDKIKKKYIYYKKSKIKVFFRKEEIIEYNLRKKNTKKVLIIEPTFSHQETIPSLIWYFNKLGVEVHILLRRGQKKSREIISYLTSIEDLNCTFFISLTEREADIISMFIKKSNYNTIFFNTLYEYWLNDGFEKKLQTLTDTGTKLILSYVHHEEKTSNCKLNVPKIDIKHTFTLSKHLEEKYNRKTLAPIIFYNEQKNIKHKTKLICVGGFDTTRRDYESLIDLCIDLNHNGFSKNYEIKILGTPYNGDSEFLKYKINISRFNLEKNIKLLGSVNFIRMFKELKESHYMLFLLNRNNEYANEYLSNKITGSLNLALGFNTIPIIDEKFANSWGIKNASVVYSNYEEFLFQLTKIIQKKQNYLLLSNNFKKIKTKLITESVNNLTKTLNNENTIF